ncbi:TetR/AcrR family transcriptional regulator [Paractinoplanes toevensis]|uniref:TetR family transcriptional regulator n=1 Tax=Paractinoplanes toevensis TaxID=571911 RepID=A0A919T6W3_9ACTN|nr:TetR/AcrR family transcriptional regulator [Actinoplanes toevensis]GIM89146.1 TetR family transcriptional regulator [Actinoplanes toevensis]
MPARERLLAAALDLFAEHGVSGTSLQMIADRLGVTKAAVYHQFPSKDDIVLAVIGPALGRLGEIAEHAESRRGSAARHEAVLAGVVDLVVGFRRVSATLSYDPVVVRLVRAHPALRDLQRIRRLLGGTAPDPGSRVRMAVIAGGLMMAGADPAVAGLDDEDFRDHLLAAGRRILRG